MILGCLLVKGARFLTVSHHLRSILKSFSKTTNFYFFFYKKIESSIPPFDDDKVRWRPQSTTFDAVFSSVTLIGSGLGDPCANVHGQSGTDNPTMQPLSGI